MLIVSNFIEDLLNNQQKIILGGAGTSHQNGAAEHAIEALVAIDSTMFSYNALRCTEDTFSTDICPMTVYYCVCT